jgi:hypothetical protein
MPNKYVFADEAGCFTFKTKAGASKYFLLCSVTTEDCAVASKLLDIRRDLCANDGEDEERDKLHATADAQATRDQVFAALADCNFRVDATLLEKRKAQPQTRTDDPTFYRYAWYYHFKHVGPLVLPDNGKLLITAAALGHKRTRAAFKAGVNNGVQQSQVPRERWAVSFMDSAKEPMLWVADYCAWAIQRKWEMADTRSYDLISAKISSEFDLWSAGRTYHY